MSPERTKAYRSVMHTLQELGPSKLLGDEQERIRHAADNLIFSSELGQDSAQEALLDTDLLRQSLVESGRWTTITADQLVADLRACGPEAAADIAAAA